MRAPLGALPLFEIDVTSQPRSTSFSAWRSEHPVLTFRLLRSAPRSAFLSATASRMASSRASVALAASAD